MNDFKTSATDRAAQKKNHRDGFTLIELIAVVALSGIITGITIATLGSLFRFDRSVNQHIEIRTELRRFSTTLRTDLRQATSFQGSNEKLIFQFEHPDPKTVRYQLESGHWIRFTDQQDQPTISTVYSLDDSLLCRCETTAASTGDRVEISFTSATQLETEAKTAQAEHSLPISRSTIITTLGRDYDYFNP